MSLATVRILRMVLFVASAALVAAGLSSVQESPWVLWLLGGLGLAVPIRHLLAKRSLKTLLESGDVSRLLNAWEAASPSGQSANRPVDRLIRATALASYGWTKRARQLLDLSGGNVNEGLEHRVFLEVLLAALEGNHSRSMQMALALCSLPTGTNPHKRPSTVHRDAALALARAFAGSGTKADDQLLHRAGRENPVLFWPTRYARAQLSLQHGDPTPAKRLIRRAPSWPEQSVFRELTRALNDALS